MIQSKTLVWVASFMKKKSLFYIITTIVLVVFIFFVITNNYINFQNHFSGGLNQVTIYSADDEMIIHVISEVEEMKQFERVFFNKITSNLGPTTSEAGNYKVTFEFDNEDLEFYILYTYSSPNEATIRFINYGRDYRLSKKEVEFLKKYIQLENESQWRAWKSELFFYENMRIKL